MVLGIDNSVQIASSTKVGNGRGVFIFAAAGRVLPVPESIRRGRLAAGRSNEIYIRANRRSTAKRSRFDEARE